MNQTVPGKELGLEGIKRPRWKRVLKRTYCTCEEGIQGKDELFRVFDSYNRTFVGLLNTRCDRISLGEE